MIFRHPKYIAEIRLNLIAYSGIISKQGQFVDFILYVDILEFKKYCGRVNLKFLKNNAWLYDNLVFIVRIKVNMAKENKDIKKLYAKSFGSFNVMNIITNKATVHKR